MKKDNFNFIDRFLYKLLFVFMIVFSLTVLDKFDIVKVEKIQNKLSEQIHILDVVDSVCGKSNFFSLNLDFDSEVSADAYTDVNKTPEGYIINLDNYNGVESIKCGIVIKIEEAENGTSTVTVQGKDGLLYCYENLTSLNCHIYQIVEAKRVLGMASKSSDDVYYYVFNVYQNNQRIDYYS